MIDSKKTLEMIPFWVVQWSPIPESIQNRRLHRREAMEPSKGSGDEVMYRIATSLTDENQKCYLVTLCPEGMK